MSKAEKLIQKIFAQQDVSYKEAERLLLSLGYELKVCGSHHVFRMAGHRHITLKQRSRLLLYQIADLQEALRDHGYEETI
jgi:hypothetical protein